MSEQATLDQQPQATTTSESQDLIDPNQQQATTPNPTPLSEVTYADEYKTNPTIKNAKTVDDLIKMTIEAQSLVGRDKIPVPGKDATPQDWDNVWNKLGRPETPENYNLKQNPQLPQGVISEERMQGFAKIAHESGLNASQASRLVQWYEDQLMGDLTGMEEVQTQQAEQATADLQREYGNAFNEKVRLANSVFRNTKGGDDARAAIKEKGLDNDTRIIKWAVEIGAIMGEDRMLGLDNSGGAPVAKTPQAAQEQLAELRKHPAYLDQYHAEHPEIMKKVQSLLDDAYVPPTTT